jgi:hypothetical protein
MHSGSGRLLQESWMWKESEGARVSDCVPSSIVPALEQCQFKSPFSSHGQGYIRICEPCLGVMIKAREGGLGVDAAR